MTIRAGFYTGENVRENHMHMCAHTQDGCKLNMSISRPCTGIHAGQMSLLGQLGEGHMSFLPLKLRLSVVIVSMKSLQYNRIHFPQKDTLNGGYGGSHL